MKQNNPTEKPARHLLTETGVNFSFAGVLPVLIAFIAVAIFRAAMGEGYDNSDLYRYLSFLLPQLCFAGAALFFFRRNRSLVREVYKPCKWYYFLIALALAFGLFSLTELNTEFLKLLGQTETPDTLPSLSGWNLLPAVLVIAVLPAIFEEAIFRGIQIKGMQKSGWGTAATLFISGALFSLFHGNPAQTVYQFICGVCYALLAVRSGSVFPTMLAHFANNAVILALQAAGYPDFPEPVKLPLYLVAGFVLLGILVWLVFFEKNGNRRGGIPGGKKYFLAASIGILICAVEWITALVQGLS